jgi:hypothetical protein
LVDMMCYKVPSADITRDDIIGFKKV